MPLPSPGVNVSLSQLGAALDTIPRVIMLSALDPAICGPLS